MRGRRASRDPPGARRPCRSGRPRRAARVARGGPPRARLREMPRCPPGPGGNQPRRRGAGCRTRARAATPRGCPRSPGRARSRDRRRVPFQLIGPRYGRRYGLPMLLARFALVRRGELERHERAHERSEAAPHGWASGTMTPAPMRYAGGRLIGSRPVIGTFPRRASATARSEARTPLQAIRYDRTVAGWLRREGLPSDPTTVVPAVFVAITKW